MKIWSTRLGLLGGLRLRKDQVKMEILQLQNKLAHLSSVA